MSGNGDYISREAAIKRFTFVTLDCLGMEPTISASDVVLALQSIPAADVRPVVKGGWEEHGEPNQHGKYEPWYYKCTRCGAVGHPEFNFCPNCGADMREES